MIKPLRNTFFDSPLWGYTLYAQLFPINSLQTFTVISHSLPLSSSSFCINVFPSLDFHKMRLLWKLRDCMNGQQGRQHAAKKHNLSRCQVDHQGLFRLERKQTLPHPPPPNISFSFPLLSPFPPYHLAPLV